MDRQTSPGLYSTVEAYASLGDHHRSGSAEDATTADWFAAELRRRGAQAVRKEAWRFDKYRPRWSLTADGEHVEAIPLYYEGTGIVDTDRPALGALEVESGGLDGWESFVEAAAESPAAVVATRSRTGLLYALNRTPGKGSGLLTLCVAPGELDRLRQCSVKMQMTADVVEGESSNVVGQFGRGPGRLLLTTAFSGWFTCAGERGTGIAICLEVAEALSEHTSVLVLGTSGHELGLMGSRLFLSKGGIDAKAIIHLGASVASGNSEGIAGPTARSDMLFATAATGSGADDGIVAVLGQMTSYVQSLSLSASPDHWLGEGPLWAKLRRPLISIVGGYPLQHSPLDTPELATTPELLHETYTTCHAAAMMLLDAVSS